MASKNLVPWEDEEEKDKKPVVSKEPENMVPWESAPAPAPSTLPEKKPSVVRQDDKLFTGTEYQPGGASNPNNMRVYAQQGEPFKLFGIPLGDIRVQPTKNEQGEPRQAFVPKPANKKAIDLNTIEDFGKPGNFTDPLSTATNTAVEGIINSGADLLDQLGGDEGSAERMIQGGALDAVRGTADFVTFMLSAGVDPESPLGGPSVEVSKAINSVNDRFQEWLPSVPAANNMEKLVQDIVSTSIGFAGGAKVAKEAIAGKSSYVQVLSEVYKAFLKKNKDPAAARAKLDALAKVLVMETGGNIGATITMDEDAGSFSEGALEQIPGFGDLNESAQNKLGQFTDNTAFSIGLGALGKVVGVGGKKILGLFGKDATKQTQIASALLQVIDNTANESLPAEEIARRASIIGDIVQKNKQFDFALGGQENSVNLDTSSALLMGAKEYYKRVFMEGAEGGMLPPEMLDQMVEANAQDFVYNVMNNKQILKSNPVVQASDAEVAAGMGGALDTAADQIMPTEQAGEAVSGVAKPVVDQLNANPADDLPLKAAESGMASFQQNNQLKQMLDDANKRGALGSDETERALLEKLTGDQLLSNWQADKGKVDELFAKVPNVKLDPTEMANMIKGAGDQEGVMAQLGLTPSEPSSVSKVPNNFVDDSGAAQSPVADLAKTIEQNGWNDLNFLVTKVRPLIAKQKANIKDSTTRINKDTSQLDAVLQWIEEAAGEQGDEFSIAMDEFRRYSDKWLNTEPLADFAEAAGNVRNVTTEGADWKPTQTFEKGGPSMRAKAMEALTKSEQAPTGEYLAKFVEALKAPGGSQDQALSQAFVGKAINALLRQGGDKLQKQQIIGAIQPYLQTLERLGTPEAKNAIKVFNDTAAAIGSLQRSVDTATLNYEAAKKAADALMEQANRSALSQFIVPTSAGRYRLKDPSSMNEAFNNFFNQPNLVERIDDVMREAGNDPLVKDGMKSELLRWLNERAIGGKAIGAKAGDGTITAVRDLAPTQIAKILDRKDGDTTLAAVHKLFDPDEAQAITQLLQIEDVFVNGRAAKANPFGSNTVSDSRLAETVNLMITLTLGVLNPTATKARGVASFFTHSNKAEVSEAIKNVMAQMLTDPTFFKQSMDMLAKDRSGKTFTQMMEKSMSASGAAMARGIYNYAHPTLDEQTEENFGDSKTDTTNQALPIN